MMVRLSNVPAFFLAISLASFSHATDTDSDGSIDSEEILAGTDINDPDERPYWWRTLDSLNGSSFGTVINELGDINADGYDDFIITAELNLYGGASSAKVISGYDASTLYTLYGENPEGSSDHFGASAAAAGDINKDGYADFIIGASWDSTVAYLAGKAILYSGADGSELMAFYGEQERDFFGHSVNNAGDINADGYDDIIIGVTFDWRIQIPGYIKVFDGLSGNQIYKISANDNSAYYGNSVTGAGDINQDGYDDFIVGDFHPYSPPHRYIVRIYSGIDASLLYEIIPEDGSSTTAIIAANGDINGDNYPDFIIGDPYFGQPNSQLGRFYVYSGIDASIAYIIRAEQYGERFATSIDFIGDIDSDGYDDIVIGKSISDKPFVKVYSGYNGAPLYRFFNEDLSINTTVVSAAGDIDADGYPDILVGANGSTSYSRIILARDLFNDLDGDFTPNHLDLDIDGDGLSNNQESSLATNAASIDTDIDGINDDIELTYGFNPVSSDSDSDGTVDGFDMFPLDNRLQTGNETLPIDSDYRGISLTTD